MDFIGRIAIPGFVLAACGPAHVPHHAGTVASTGADAGPPIGALPAADIQRVVKAEWLRLKDCYAALLERSPDAQGVVHVAFVSTSMALCDRRGMPPSLPMTCIAETEQDEPMLTSRWSVRPLVT